ncbi:MAG: AGE family epimerase/isomerase, partial [Pirellulales bacterium]|nr:AGE family epimerase/isomerase [Pirellulales bacterium]
NPEYDLLNEVLNHDFSRPENAYRNLVYTGHGIETLWMVLHEAQRRKDQELFDKTARLLKRTMEVAWDDVYGGFFRCLKDVEKNDWILDKAAWVQEEALIGALLIIEQSDPQWAREWFSRVYAFVLDKYPLKKHGYALWDCWPDRKVTFVKSFPRIENFHHPRHLMLNLATLERMLKRR